MKQVKFTHTITPAEVREAIIEALKGLGITKFNVDVANSGHTLIQAKHQNIDRDRAIWR